MSSDGDLGHLQMIYPEFVDAAMRSQEPVTWREEIGDNRVIHRAAQYDPESETVWRADIDEDTHPDYDYEPSVGFEKCYPTADAEFVQSWSSLATGRLTGPQKIGPWESLFTVFNSALHLFHGKREPDFEGAIGDDE